MKPKTQTISAPRQWGLLVIPNHDCKAQEQWKSKSKNSQWSSFTFPNGLLELRDKFLKSRRLISKNPVFRNIRNELKCSSQMSGFINVGPVTSCSSQWDSMGIYIVSATWMILNEEASEWSSLGNKQELWRRGKQRQGWSLGEEIHWEGIFPGWWTHMSTHTHTHNHTRVPPGTLPFREFHCESQNPAKGREKPRGFSVAIWQVEVGFSLFQMSLLPRTWVASALWLLFLQTSAHPRSLSATSTVCWQICYGHTSSELNFELSLWEVVQCEHITY